MNVALLGAHLALAGGLLLTAILLSAAVVLLGWAVLAERKSSASRRPAYVLVRTDVRPATHRGAIFRAYPGLPSSTPSRAPPRPRRIGNDLDSPGEPFLE